MSVIYIIFLDSVSFAMLFFVFPAETLPAFYIEARTAGVPKTAGVLSTAGCAAMAF
jgi:hypothetical protein